MKRLAILFVICVKLNLVDAQNLSQEDFGFRIGAVFCFGTHIQSLGISAQAYYYRDFAQVNLGVKANYNMLNLGPKIGFWELVPNSAVHIFWGTENKKDLYNPEFLNESIQSSRPYSLGYGIKYYLDSRKTSQATGVISINYNNILFATENDVFISFGEDKFRTGSFNLMYHRQELAYYISVRLWTGAMNKSKHVMSQNYPSDWGFMDISESLYGKNSNGILSLGARYTNVYHQSFNMEIGIDSEWIRHFFQNKLIHDMPLLPDKWNYAQNPHFPMLKDDGTPYLFKGQDRVKRAKFFGQVGINQELSY